MPINLKQFRELTKDLSEETEIKTLLYSNMATSCKRAVVANYQDKSNEIPFICLNAMGTHLPDEWEYIDETKQ